VPVSISQTVTFSGSIPLSITVPLDIRADDPPVQRSIDGLRSWLLELRDSFEMKHLFRFPGSM
jgi:hypothetical protein